jgi:hypothetical protein
MHPETQVILMILQNAEGVKKQIYFANQSRAKQCQTN